MSTQKVFFKILVLVFIIILISTEVTYAETENMEKPRYLLTIPTAYILEKGKDELSIYTAIWKESIIRKREGISYEKYKSTCLYAPIILNKHITDNLELIGGVRIWRIDNKYYCEYFPGEKYPGSISQRNDINLEWRPYIGLKVKLFTIKDIVFAGGFEGFLLLPILDSNLYLIATKSFSSFLLNIGLEWGETWLGYNMRVSDSNFIRNSYAFLSLNIGTKYSLNKKISLIGEFNAISPEEKFSDDEYSKFETAFTFGINYKITTNINSKIGFQIPTKWKKNYENYVLKGSDKFYPICILGISYQLYQL